MSYITTIRIHKDQKNPNVKNKRFLSSSLYSTNEPLDEKMVQKMINDWGWMKDIEITSVVKIENIINPKIIEEINLKPEYNNFELIIH